VQSGSGGRRPAHCGRGAQRRRLVARPGLVALCLATLAGCGHAGESVSRAAILTSNDSTFTAHVLLVSSATGADGGFNFDGYGNGGMRVTIPLGWRVDVTCKNASATLSHSCAIVDDGPLSPFGAAVAFPGASTPDPKSGVLPNVSNSFGFVASRAGTYRIACLVSGHEIDGMWDWLDVVRGGLPRLST
jgi:uncharacterized cupredoxin-like copper-binding protein